MRQAGATECIPKVTFLDVPVRIERIHWDTAGWIFDNRPVVGWG
jgi:hypothetical protein